MVRRTMLKPLVDLDMPVKLFLFFMMLSQTVTKSMAEESNLLEFCHNKQIPSQIEKNVLTALSFYPELKNTTIDFIFKRKIKTSVMQAQPVFNTLLGKRRNRRYRINISEHFELINSQMPIL